MADDDTKLVLDVGRAIGRKVRLAIGRELERKAAGLNLQRVLFFSALTQLVVEVFAVAPTTRPQTIAERRAAFDEFIRATTDDFDATLRTLNEDAPSRTFTRDERVAMGELIKAASVCTTSRNEGVRVLGAVSAERAAGIWRGEIAPCVATDADLDAFAKSWDVTTAAKFSPKPRTRRKRADV